MIASHASHGYCSDVFQECNFGSLQTHSTVSSSTSKPSTRHELDMSGTSSAVLRTAGITKKSKMSASKAQSRSNGTTRGTPTRTRVARTCYDAHCGKNPYFGWHGGKAIFCVSHKDPGELRVECRFLASCCSRMSSCDHHLARSQ